VVLACVKVLERDWPGDIEENHRKPH